MCSCFFWNFLLVPCTDLLVRSIIILSLESAAFWAAPDFLRVPLERREERGATFYSTNSDFILPTVQVPDPGSKGVRVPSVEKTLKCYNESIPLLNLSPDGNTVLEFFKVFAHIKLVVHSWGLQYQIGIPQSFCSHKACFTFLGISIPNWKVGPL